MNKILLLAALTISGLLSFNICDASTLGTAKVIIKNNTVDSPGANEIASIIVQGKLTNLAAQNQATITVPTGTTFIIKVDKILLQNKPISHNNFIGCANGINMTLQAGQTAIMTMTANTNPVNNNSIFACAYTK